jgi:cell wall-associated NlpC family hydrolase
MILNGSTVLVNDAGLKQSTCGGAPRCLLPAAARPGDLIFANWSRPSFGGISHVGMLVSVGGQLEIAQHTKDRIDTLQVRRAGGPGSARVGGGTE